jgi:hypothetical protein
VQFSLISISLVSAIFFNQEEGCEFDQFTLFGWWADLIFVVMSWEIGMYFGNSPSDWHTVFTVYKASWKNCLAMSGLLVRFFKCKSATEK